MFKHAYYMGKQQMMLIIATDVIDKYHMLQQYSEWFITYHAGMQATVRDVCVASDALALVSECMRRCTYIASNYN